MPRSVSTPLARARASFGTAGQVCRPRLRTGALPAFAGTLAVPEMALLRFLLYFRFGTLHLVEDGLGPAVRLGSLAGGDARPGLLASAAPLAEGRSVAAAGATRPAALAGLARLAGSLPRAPRAPRATALAGLARLARLAALAGAPRAPAAPSGQGSQLGLEVGEGVTPTAGKLESGELFLSKLFEIGHRGLVSSFAFGNRHSSQRTLFVTAPPDRAGLPEGLNTLRPCREGQGLGGVG